MRIIAGKWRGRRLVTPRGYDIRPTSDRAREALFSILDHGEPRLADARFLDLFSGSGAIGIEALSRGAAEVVLVENDWAAASLIATNLRALGEPAGARLVQVDATRLGPAPHPFEFAVLDPPYRSALARPALDALLAGGWLAAGARVVVELAAGEPLDPPAGLIPEQERRYGAAAFVFMRHP